MQEIASAFGDRQCSGEHQRGSAAGASRRLLAVGRQPAELCKTVVRCLQSCWVREHAGHQALAADADGGGETGEELPHFAGDSSDEEEGGEEIDPSSVSKDVLKQIMKLHTQTGHQSKRRLVRALAIAGAPEEAIRAAKLLKCEVCHERQRPRTHGWPPYLDRATLVM